MPTLHDADFRASVLARLDRLRPDSKPLWGKMSVDQMLWHCNAALDLALGHTQAEVKKLPIPKPVLRFMVINLPWGKSAPTHPSLVASQHYDFESERGTTRRLIGEFAQRGLDASWGAHPLLGLMPGRNVSRLQAKHLDHHLKQFGV